MYKKTTSKCTTMAVNKVPLKSFSLLSFTGELTEAGLREVEGVPSSWIKFDDELCSCVVHYMGPPYNKETKKLLTDLIKTQAAAPKDWPWYPIEPRGHAQTYSDGMQRLRALEKKPYVYSTDSESHGKQRADEITNILKSKSQKRVTAERIMAISGSSSSEDLPSIQSHHTEDSNLSSDEPCTTVKTKKTNLREIENRSTPKATQEQQNPRRSKQPDKPITATPRLPKNGSTSKRILNSITQPAINPNSVPDANIIELDKDVDTQLGTVEKPAMLEEIMQIGNFSKDTAFIWVAIKKLTVRVESVVKELEALRTSVEHTLKTKGNQVSILKFAEKYDFQKLSTVAEYEAFNQRLVNDVEYIKDLKTALECLLDSDLQRTITRIIKKIFDRGLAMTCTAFRKSKDKFLLRNTPLYNLLFDFVGRFHKGPTGGVITEKEFYNTLSSCLTNSKDWDGNRKLRAIQPVPI